MKDKQLIRDFLMEAATLITFYLFLFAFPSYLRNQLIKEQEKEEQGCTVPYGTVLVHTREYYYKNNR